MKLATLHKRSVARTEIHLVFIQMFEPRVIVAEIAVELGVSPRTLLRAVEAQSEKEEI